MDVTRQNFHAHLPMLLESISNAAFIAIDLELSGISTRSKNLARGGRARAEAWSLQERYQDVKLAAEKYQVLQVGFTCVELLHEQGELELLTPVPVEPP